MSNCKHNPHHILQALVPNSYGLIFSQECKNEEGYERIRDKSNVQCYNCGKFGHFSNEYSDTDLRKYNSKTSEDFVNDGGDYGEQIEDTISLIEGIYYDPYSNGLYSGFA